MADPIVEFPDAVEVVVNYLRPALADVPVVTQIPNPRPAEFVRIKRLGGLPDSKVTDRPRIDVACWSDTEEGAEALMKRARAFTLAMKGKRGATTVYRVREVSGPMWQPDSESGSPKYVFAFEASMRGAPL